jgi:hypothetical protein
MLQFIIKTSVHSLLHVSVHLDHLQGAYGYTFAELSVKYIIKSFAVQSVSSCHTLHGTRYTQQPETHVAPTLQNF